MWKTQDRFWAQFGPFAHILTPKGAGIHCTAGSLALFRKPQIRQAIGAENGSGACLSTNEKAIKRLKPSFCTKGEYAKKNEPQLCLEY
jgi:hypothetical protein